MHVSGNVHCIVLQRGVEVNSHDGLFRQRLVDGSYDVAHVALKLQGAVAVDECRGNSVDTEVFIPFIATCRSHVWLVGVGGALSSGVVDAHHDYLVVVDAFQCGVGQRAVVAAWSREFLHIHPLHGLDGRGVVYPRHHCPVIYRIFFGFNLVATIKPNKSYKPDKSYKYLLHIIFNSKFLISN